MQPPFHAEHIGSFVRPARLIEAARSRKSGAISEAQFMNVQDDCIREIVAFQESIGLPSITDGEFRRRSWSAGFIDAVEGFGLRDGTLRFLKSVVKRGVPKVTIAAPDVMHWFLGPRSYDSAVYADRESFFEDLKSIYRQEIAELAKEGCTYLQIDDTALPCNCDPSARKDVVARGEDPDELTVRYARLFNESIAGKPKDMKVAIHLCRGNLKGAWMAEGGYEPVAEALFNRLDADIYCLEYDTPRAGDFSPLRHLPKGKHVVLGLVSTKTATLENKDQLKRRIDEAAKYVPLERLGISPQCGFSSGGGSGQTVTQDDTRRKLELVMQLAQEIWS